MADRRKQLLDLIQERLIPVLHDIGFERVSLSRDDQRSPDMRRAFPLGILKRHRKSVLDVIEIQLDKHGAARFVVNFGIVPPEGICLPWAQLAQEEVTASDLPEAYRLHSKENSLKWFSPSIFAWPLDFSSRARRTVDHAVALIPEIEEWFASRKVGQHIRPMVRAVVPHSNQSAR
jgi:hypothetical protein